MRALYRALPYAAGLALAFYVLDVAARHNHLWAVPGLAGLYVLVRVVALGDEGG